jgi:hypothetical protein
VFLKDARCNSSKERKNETPVEKKTGGKMDWARVGKHAQLQSLLELRRCLSATGDRQSVFFVAQTHCFSTF